MIYQGAHISDQDLLQAVDGELSRRKNSAVYAHCENCWNCRARMAAIASTITDFAQAHRQTLDAQLGPITGPRTLLRARLAEDVVSVGSASRSWFPRHAFVRMSAIICSSLLLAGVVGGAALWRVTLERKQAYTNLLKKEIMPNHYLTPGATRRVSISELCSMPHEEVIRRVPDALRWQVLAEYGIKMANADDYEIDYLITPGLGGADDIHNLWPEPYKSPVWNARVKDALEERLHELVCAHEVNLESAQQEIATDWIAAYKKYFHMDKPQSGSLSGGAPELVVFNANFKPETLVSNLLDLMDLRLQPVNVPFFMP